MPAFENFLTKDSKLLLFNKPYGVVSQFSESKPHKTLADFIPLKDVYPAGRLDTDSEGLLLLTNNGKLQEYLSAPKFAKLKVYLVQVEGIPSKEQLLQLSLGVNLGGFVTKPARVEVITEPSWLWPRNPPIRWRKNIPTSWIELTISEGKNRQVRKMTAKVGLPTLRLVRYAVDKFTLDGLALGEFKLVTNFDKLRTT